MPSEEKWYALAGRVVDAKAEGDGDIHMALVDATETTLERLAPNSSWPKMVRNSTTGIRLDGAEVSFGVKTAHELKIGEPHVITVTGKAFYDIGRACGPLKPEKDAERLRGLGNSSGDENGSDSMKYWEIIAENLSQAGLSWGCSSQIDSTGRIIFTADAYSKGGRLRFIVLSDDRLSAFMELERGTRDDAD